MFTFIIPVYIKPGDKVNLNFFKQSIESIIAQSDPEWSIVIVDDCSYNIELNNYLDEMKRKLLQQIQIHHNETNMGPGMSRNIGIDIADSFDTKVVMFQDADDMSHPNRVKITKEIFENQSVDLVYSKFIPIDENNVEIDEKKLSSSIQEIVQVTKTNAPSGKDVWKIIGTQSGYINLTSTTSVRIEVAKKTPFPKRRAAEDSYTWMLYSAKGAIFYFTDEIPSLYRIPQDTAGSASRSYLGKSEFYIQLTNTTEESFIKCMEYALKEKTISEEECKELLIKFRIRLAQTLRGEGMYELADQYLKKN